MTEGQRGYRQLAKLFAMVSADNGGCTADEIEVMLAHCSDFELSILAAGEEDDQEKVKAALREVFDDSAVEALDQILNVAFQGPLSFDEHLQQWVNDLQAGMYINCVYCGHRYGPSEDVPASMADVLKDHVEQCPKHPMSKLKAAIDEIAEQKLSEEHEQGADEGDYVEGYDQCVRRARQARDDIA